MKMLDEYFELQEKVFAYFGYVEDWRVLPLDDCREYYWHLTGEGHGDNVCFAKTEKELVEQDGDYYESEIYTQRHLPKWVYRGEEYTLVVVDTHTDGNQLLSVFSNSKERVRVELYCFCCGNKFHRPTTAEILRDGLWRSFFCSRTCRAKGIDTSRKYPLV